MQHIERPFLKWAGSKQRVIKHIHEVLPKANRLIEPFAGSGAVFINTDYPSYLIAEINHDLINLYQILQREGKQFIDYCRQYFVDENNRESHYYLLREEFNNSEYTRRRAALFLYLNKHGYNGLCRYNSNGIYNVPFGRYKKIRFPEQKIKYFYEKTKNTEFLSADFVTTMQQAQIGDVVYCDPPYVPLSATANFTHYSQTDFDLTMQIQLTQQAELLVNKGIPVIISNHDTEFTRDQYKNAEIISFPVQRFISRDGANRKPVQEILAVFR